jgi:hypothetical protein
VDDFLNDCYGNAYNSFYKGKMQDTCKFIVEAVNYCRSKNYEVPSVFSTMAVMVMGVDKQGELSREQMSADAPPPALDYAELVEKLPDLNQINNYE